VSECSFHAKAAIWERSAGLLLLVLSDSVGPGSSHAPLLRKAAIKGIPTRLRRLPCPDELRGETTAPAYGARVASGHGDGRWTSAALTERSMRVPRLASGDEQSAVRQRNEAL
jgi:hypothetical protein